MALTFEVEWILNSRYWRLMCECVNNVHIIRGIGHGANLNVGYPSRAAVLGLAGGRGVAAKVPDARPRPPSRVWLQPRASAAAHLSLAQPQHFTCCLVTATSASASAHLAATPAQYYFRYYSHNGVIALCATVLSHPGSPQGMQLMNSIP